MNVRFEELTSQLKTLFLFGDQGYYVNRDMGKNLDTLGQTYLVKAFNARKCIVEGN